MQWKIPPKIKVYEALGAIVDGRVKADGYKAVVFSSSGGKQYDVTYSPDENIITSNDNGSYWQGYLGYPSIALLIALGVIKCDRSMAQFLKGVPWKDLNVKNRNNYTLTEEVVKAKLRSLPDFSEAKLDREIESILEQISRLKLSRPKRAVHAPTGY